MRKLIIIGSIALLLVVLAIYRLPSRIAQAVSATHGSSPALPAADEMDRLLAPIALYPDQLLAQILICAMDPAGVRALDQFLRSHADLKGTDLQDAALK